MPSTILFRKRLPPIALAVASACLFLTCGGGGGGGTTGNGSAANTAPVISAYTATPTLLPPGQSSSLTVTASDADGDALSYEYTASGGTISPAGAQATWTAPSTATPGSSFTVTVTVKDGKCTNDCPSPSKTFDIADESSLPKLSSDVQPIFTSSCAFSSCHGGSQPPLLTSGNSFNELVNQESLFTSGKKRVLPGEPTESVLYLRISGTSAGNQMPLNRSPLSTADQEKIKNWIRAGAKND